MTCHKDIIRIRHIRTEMCAKICFRTKTSHITLCETIPWCRNTLSSPRPCFVIVLNLDLYVYRDGSFELPGN